MYDLAFMQLNSAGSTILITFSFEKRNAHILTRRKPELLTASRAKALTLPTLQAFFEMWGALLEDLELQSSPERIFNCDETGLNSDQAGEKVYIKKGCKDAYLKTVNSVKTTYTVLFCSSARGEYLPPFVVYKAKHLYQSWMMGGPRGTGYAVTDSGWMEDGVFQNWFTQKFVKQTEHLVKPIILTFDGHASHLTYTVVKAAKDNGIQIVALPPNTSHALQPLDVGVFKSIKTNWKKILQVWFTESRLQAVDKNTFPVLLQKLFCTLNPQHAINAFRASGLFPVDMNAVVHRIRSGGEEVVESSPEAPHTPKSKLRNAILACAFPSSHPTTAEPRRRVQGRNGEVLTQGWRNLKYIAIVYGTLQLPMNF